jgi:1,4-dihydroxy-2-naphthoate octaprenyltransferase
VIFKVLPYYSLFALITVVPIYKVYGMLKPENPSAAYLPLMGASLKATVRCGAIMIVALLARGLFQ